MASYKCNGCDKIFEQETYSSLCPDCKAKGGSSFMLFLKKYRVWIVVGLILIILLVIIVGNGDDSGLKPSKVAIDVSFEHFEDGIEVVFYEHELIDKNRYSPKSKRVVNQSTAQRLARVLGFRIYDSRGNFLPLHNNRFYPCYHTDTISVNWSDNKQNPLYRPSKRSKQIPFKMMTENPNPLACKIKFEITEVMSLASCRVLVKTNYDNLEDSADIWVSVEGRKGDYQQKRIFDAKNVDEYNVWAILNDDTAAFVTLNGTPFVGIDCNIIPPDIGDIIDIGNSYGSNPNSIKTLEDFFSLPGISMNETIFYIDSRRIGPKANIENTMRIIYQNEGITFKIDPSNIKISNDRVIEVPFKTIPK